MSGGSLKGGGGRGGGGCTWCVDMMCGSIVYLYIYICGSMMLHEE